MTSSGKIKTGNNSWLHQIFYHLDRLNEWNNGTLVPPIYVDLSPTSACNQKCFFCFADFVRENPKFIEEKLLISIVEQLAQYGVRCCEIQGTGEPFLNKATPDAIVTGSKLGMSMCVVTNGTVVTEDILEKILPHTSFFRISNFEAHKELYCKTHGVKKQTDHFQYVVKCIQNAVKIKKRDNLDVVITATIVLFDYNLYELPNAISLLKLLGVDIAHVKHAGHLQHNKNQTWPDVKNTSYDESQGYYITKAKAFEDNNFKVNFREDYSNYYINTCQKDYSKCYGVELSTHIASNGKLYPCYPYYENEEYCFGDLNKNTFDEIWWSKQKYDVLTKFYAEVDNKKCTHICKQHSSNSILNNLKNPPLHARTF